MKKAIIGLTMFLVLLGGLYYIDSNFIRNIGEEDSVPYIEKDQMVNQQETQREIGIRRDNIAADFTLVNLNGEEESLSDYRGKKVILNFWASYCPPCREEMPDLNEFYLQNKDEDIVVLGVNLGESPKVAGDFMEKNNFQFPTLIDEKESVGLNYGIMFLPTTYFINEEGIIEDLHVGVITLEALNNRYK